MSETSVALEGGIGTNPGSMYCLDSRERSAGEATAPFEKGQEF